MIGMGRSIYDSSPEARTLISRANAVLGYPLEDLLFKGPLERLNQTRFTQPALFVVSLMTLTALSAQRPDLSAAYVAGHSVGEYAALVACNAVSFEDALALLITRAQTMDKASPKDAMGHPMGAMCAILGADFETLTDYLHSTFSTSPELCALANDNCPGQVVLTGLRHDVEQARNWATEHGARKGVMLPVSGPFHSVWMRQTEKALRQQLEKIPVHDALPPLVSNVTACPVTSSVTLRDLLPRQVTSPVRWRESILTLSKLGIDTFVEVGPGQVLTGLAKRCVPNARFFSIQTADDISALPKDICSAA